MGRVGQAGSTNRRPGCENITKYFIAMHHFWYSNF